MIEEHAAQAVEAEMIKPDRMSTAHPSMLIAMLRAFAVSSTSARTFNVHPCFKNPVYHGCLADLLHTSCLCIAFRPY